MLETRQAPDPGSGESRWEQLADTLSDCFALLAASAGQRPREVLGGRGIRVILTEENIEGSVDVLYGGGKKQKCKK
jgi:nitrogen fixation protein NifB